MTGTDFGHVDMSVEIDALRSLSRRWQSTARAGKEDLGT